MILAGVSIGLVLDNNGIIQKSKEARREYEQAKDNEQAQLEKLSNLIDEKTNGNGGTKTNPTVLGWEKKKESNSTINGGGGNSNNPTIPAGYVPINTATSNWGDGKSAPTQDSVDHGLVIKDDKDNEWVWIPVDSTTLQSMIETSDEEILCGTEVTTDKYSRSEIISGITRTSPGTTDGSREPDLIIGYEENECDVIEEYYKIILGFESKEEMAEAFVSDYNEMIESIQKYGGFYIGRYELSEAGVQKDKATLTEIDWYNLYKKCKELNASDKVETRMIWGCQWDVTMNWLISSGAKTSDEVNKDSRSWGNYKDVSVKADDGITEIKKSGISSLLNTGVTTFTIANNIYDLAGNCLEWTQEASDASLRIFRGSIYDDTFGPSRPASYRKGDNPDYGARSGLRFSPYFNNKVRV